jgi:hypothetical protein
MTLLRDAARWIFFAALVYAPWAYGGTTPESIQIINWLLLAAFIVWIIELLISGRRPELPRGLLFLTCALIGIGGWMALNARLIYDSDFDVFVPLRNFAPHLTGSVDYAISAAWMMRGALLLGAILFVVDLSQDNRWLLRLWYMIGLIAGSLAFLGLLQKATGATMIFWQTAPPWGVSTFFATYYYHANAGAFLNLVWPLTAGLAVRAFTKPCSPAMRAMWVSVFVLVLAAVLANTSRMAQLIALLLLIALCVQLGPDFLQLSGREKIVALAGSVAIFLTLLALGQVSHLEQPLNRWRMLSQNLPKDARWLASHVAIGALPDIGFFGFGPGTFRAVFPFYNSVANDHAPGMWRFLHEDYLQTALEWGWLGSGLWALLFFGGIVIAIRSYKKPGAREWAPRRRLLQPFVIVALGGVALHALVDFPLQIASIQLYVATYLGLCWGSSLWQKPDAKEGRGGSPNRPGD